MTFISLLILGRYTHINYIANLHSDNRFAIATQGEGVLVIKVTKENSLVLTNISFGSGLVHSVINIDKRFIALCFYNGIEVYNKDTQ